MPDDATRPFDHAPFLVVWEVTRACQLSCRHCRADAQPDRDPDELTTAEGQTLLQQIRDDFGPVLVVLTGGDPLLRADLFDLIAHGDRLSLRMTVSPSATEKLTAAAIKRLRDAGMRRMAVSLDGADAATHDAFRGVPGTYDRTLAAMVAARELGVELQLQTTLGQHNRGQIPAFVAIGARHRIAMWSVFLLVPTGRAAPDLLLTAAEHERTYRELALLANDPAMPFAVKTTAGQPFYRVLAQLRGAAPTPQLTRRDLVRPGALRSPSAVNDGVGFVFVGRSGDICPSGFLPLVCGNVRRQSLADVYRTHPTFVRLRRPETSNGKCGTCEYNRICGGSRSRTFALTGDPFGSDPTCVYQPEKGRR